MEARLVGLLGLSSSLSALQEPTQDRLKGWAERLPSDTLQPWAGLPGPGLAQQHSRQNVHSGPFTPSPVPPAGHSGPGLGEMPGSQWSRLTMSRQQGG